MIEVHYTMQFITGTNRHRTFFSTLEYQVAMDNPVRLINAFVDKFDLHELGFTNTIHKSEGRPPYTSSVLLKLYLYGYLNKIRSSCKLEKECICFSEFEIPNAYLRICNPPYILIPDLKPNDKRQGL
jgi:hypothetical protein